MSAKTRPSLSSRLAVLIALGKEASQCPVENKYHRAEVRSQHNFNRLVSSCISDGHKFSGPEMSENFANGDFIVAMFQNRELLEDIYKELCLFEELMG